MEMFGVSRATVRRALLTLASEGLIDRSQGRASRVAYRRVTLASPRFEHDIHRIEKTASATDVAVLEYGPVIPPANIAEALEQPVGVEVLRICRVRSAEGQPLRYLINHVPLGLGGQMRREQFETMTLTAILRELGHEPRRFDDELSAVLADPLIAEALEVRIGSPLVEITRLMFDESGPVAHQWTLLPPGRRRLSTSIEAAAGSSG
jgi:GntR family transcriptional regulator